MHFETSVFSSADELLNNRPGENDILILDIDMPGMNGMDAARAIRSTDQRVVILFITNMAQYAINGYEVDAVDYVIKPIGYYDFVMKLKKALRRMNRLQPEQLAIDSEQGLRRVAVAEILYVEVMGHYLIYHTVADQFRVRGSMKEAESFLLRHHFYRCHKSYLVNLAHVSNIQSGQVSVSGEQLPLGRTFKDSLMSAYLRYLRG